MAHKVHAVKAVKDVQAAKAVKAVKALPAKSNVKPPLQAAKKDITVPVGSNVKTLQKAPAIKMFTIKEPVVIDLRAVDTEKLKEVSAQTQFDVEFLKTEADFEGVSPRIYDGNTVGIGHFTNDDPRFKGKKDIFLTQDEIYQLYTEDLIKKEGDIENALPNFSSLTKGQHEALMSLFFNSKPQALTGIINAVAHGRFDEAIRKMAIIYSGGKVAPGLCKRRIDNIERFAHGSNPEVAKATILGIVAKAKGRKDVQLAAQQAQKKLDEAWELQQNPQNNPVVASNN